MSVTPPIPQELWDQIPAAAQAAVLALVQSLERRIAALAGRRPGATSTPGYRAGRAGRGSRPSSRCSAGPTA